MTYTPTIAKKYISAKEMEAAWDDLIDIPSREGRELTDAEMLELTELTAALYEKYRPAPLLPVEVMQARFTELESMLATSDDAGVFEKICAELTELQAAIEKENGAFDDRYDAIICAKHGVSL